MQDEQNQALHWEDPSPAKVPRWVKEFPRESSRSGGVSVCLEGLQEWGVSPAGGSQPSLPSLAPAPWGLAPQNLTP